MAANAALVANPVATIYAFGFLHFMNTPPMLPTASDIITERMEWNSDICDALKPISPMIAAKTTPRQLAITPFAQA